MCRNFRNPKNAEEEGVCLVPKNTRFKEMESKNGGRYPPKSSYVIICGINKHLQEANSENAVNIQNKSDTRY